MNLRTIGFAALAAVALVAGRAQAQEASTTDGGWNSKYGFVFTLPNLLQNGSSTVIDSYNGLIGLQVDTSAQTGLRLGVTLSRQTFGIVETTNYLGQVSKSVPTWTSIYGVGLEGLYLMRVTQAAVSPYFGLGAGIGYTQFNRNGDAVTTGGTVTSYDNFVRDWSLELIGTGGIEWRVHKVIALFAEYRADLELYRSSKGETKIYTNGVASTLNGKASSSAFLNLSESIAQGGALGVIAFF